MGATMLLGLASCSDDHFDIKNGTASANNTIWQNLQANPDKFSDVSSILQKVRVYKSLEDKKRTLTYAELLNQPQTLTFWAPVNGSFDPQPYLSRINQINSYREQGLTDKADTLEYNLGMQFAQTTWLVSTLSQSRKIRTSDFIIANLQLIMQVKDCSMALNNWTRRYLLLMVYFMP